MVIGISKLLAVATATTTVLVGPVLLV